MRKEASPWDVKGEHQGRVEVGRGRQQSSGQGHGPARRRAIETRRQRERGAYDEVRDCGCHRFAGARSPSTTAYRVQGGWRGSTEGDLLQGTGEVIEDSYLLTIAPLDPHHSATQNCKVLDDNICHRKRTWKQHVVLVS